MTRATPPIELTGTEEHLGADKAPIPGELLSRLRASVTTTTVEQEVAEASRDWWPISLHWSLAGQVPVRAWAVCKPTDVEQVAHVMRECSAAGVPVTPSGGRSGVCGAAVPAFGGVVLDLTELQGIVSVDAASGVVEVLPGTFGRDLESTMRAVHGMTLGHWPQSMDISTVGGWVACRGSGQYSTRYGKIEDMVTGLEVVLADGRIIRTGGAPRASTGPDLTQLFLGSEGTLGVITRVWMRAHPAPPAERHAAYAFAEFDTGLEVCRRSIRRGATPAVLRLYDAVESKRAYHATDDECVLLVLDEGDSWMVDTVMAIVDDECRTAGGRRIDDSLVTEWLGHRNDTSGLQALTYKGLVVDTMEIAAPWSRLSEIFHVTRDAILAVPHARAATCHLSHSYVDGACLYFTFAGSPPAEEVDATYVALWDAGQRAVLAHGGNLSHHHGIGLNRSRFMREALGDGLDVLAAVKHALDPAGILNPGKLGLPNPFGEVSWP
ncbi:MAG: FAD-binding oxidoreductase [Ilumatobacteraceae bacterium]